MRYTQRQIGLFYREAIAFEAESHAAGIIAANLGFTGGKEAQKAVKKLTRKPLS